VLDSLATFRERIDESNRMLRRLCGREQSQTSGVTSVQQDDDADIVPDSTSTEESAAIDDLQRCLRLAEEYHERYTSEYTPSPHSVLGQEDEQEGLPSGMATPVFEGTHAIRPQSPGSLASSLSRTQVGDEEDDDSEDDWLPLETLNGCIDSYEEKANLEKGQGHWNQAEENLQAAIHYSKIRTRYHNVPFADRVRMQQDVAFLYQKQGKFGEAIGKLSDLMRESADESEQARLQKLLSAVYFDRYTSAKGKGETPSKDDVESAEKYARRAFRAGYHLLKNSEQPAEFIERHNSCIHLLVQILHARDKSVEATEFAKLLPEDSLSDALSTGESDGRRRSSVRSSTGGDDFVVVEDKQEMFIHALKSNNFELVQNLLGDSEVSVEKPDKTGKAPLFYAVEFGDESIVHKLLDPALRLDINAPNTYGVTALHHAATLGLHDKVQCLLKHDAEIDIRDNGDRTPLLKAVRNNQLLVVKVLHDNGANFCAVYKNEWSLLHFAATQLPSTEMVTKLLDLSPELKDAVDVSGRTALSYCAEMDRVEHAEALLTHRNHLDVLAVDSVSRSALYFAASKAPNDRRVEMVRLLLHHGAQFNPAKAPLKWQHYDALRRFQTPRRRSSNFSRNGSVSTENSVGTTSSGQTVLSRMFSGRMHLRG
jgi:ankyrin repeat protein/tetratricopeptide (TPR) repeat protein